ncbi:MAG: 3-hydroxyacyl-CoA dehydrogenase NAD-binding domain-containing protein [Acidiphilium sp.]
MNQHPVHLDIADGIAVIAIDNPPVNALGHAVRTALVAALDRAEADAAVRAIVLTGSGRIFSAGADIAEFDAPPRQPILHAVIERFDACRKPTIAALSGTALGGALELAMGCHCRVATENTRMGLPEVKLGLLPGAGGTQRLPRLIGPEKSVAVIVSGRMIGAREALEDGLIDAIVADLQAAIAYARNLDKPPPRVRDRDDKLAAARTDPTAFEAAAATAMKRLAGIDAPAACVASVRNAFTLPFDAGVADERALFMGLVAGEQSRAQRHVFFAERAARKVPGLDPAIKPAKIARAAVIGAGTMGVGIAMNFANAGIPVVLLETDATALARGLSRMRETYAISERRGALKPGTAERRMALVTGTTDWNAMADADVAVEAVFEDLPLKREVFAKLDVIARPGALLATNTSTLDIDAIASATQRPEDVLGMHFFSPANVMRLLEIVRGKATSPTSIATAIALGTTLGKAPVVVGNCDGFVGNRMLARRTAACERLLQEGALPTQVDAAAKAFGFPMGPFAAADLAGLDIGWRIRQRRGTKMPIADALCERGRFGQKTGRGYYLYEDGSRTPAPDPEVEALIVGTSKRLGIPRREIGHHEIIERLLYPMIDEAAHILAEGIATRPSDIDVVWVAGYGWPAWRGGPCFYADQLGLDTIAAKLDHAGTPPSEALRALAEAGLGFSRGS